MAPKPPPKPPPKPSPKPRPPKNAFQRFNDYLDSDQGKERTKILVAIFFVLAVVMFYLYRRELNKGRNLILAVASIRQFAVDYDPSLLGKSDLEILATVHRHTLLLFNWTLKNEELQRELDILIDMLPGWQAFEKNLYFFSTTRKNWQEARDDCLGRHTADLVSCRFGEEQGFIDEIALQNKMDYWIGLNKTAGAARGLLWTAGFGAGTLYWAKGQPNGGNRARCIAILPKGNIKGLWHDDRCANIRRFICKMVPKDKWFY